MLSAAQQEQVEKQRKRHFHKTYAFDLELGCGVVHGFVVERRVWRPDVTSAIVLAKYLGSQRSKNLFSCEAYQHRVLDMCTGSGIQAVVAALQGASHVTAVDITPAAVANACLNLVTHAPDTSMSVIRSDLFDRVPEGERFDVIICNHPFFEGVPDGQIARCMLDPGDLVVRFFREAPRYLAPGGFIVTPFLHMAGPTNDPRRVAEEQGLRVEEVVRVILAEGMQRGLFSVYEIQVP
jgi:methylase of polypeptide subunit release factors